MREGFLFVLGSVRVSDFEVPPFLQKNCSHRIKITNLSGKQIDKECTLSSSPIVKLFYYRQNVPRI